MGLYDFRGLAALLLQDAARWLVTWCPGGKVIGREYTAGTIRGGQGDSFKCNVETGAWKDFATGEAGGDLISLFCAIEGLKQGAAAKHLADLVNYPLSSDRPIKGVIKHDPPNIGLPPPGAIVPPMIHPKFGDPVATWEFTHPSGQPIYYEARYDTPEGKQYIPWAWNKTTGKWTAKAFPEPRPLWGLNKIFQQRAAPVLIVEGPKCAEAAEELARGVYLSTTWSGGAQAYKKADWEPLKGRDVLIWPDADEPGRRAAAGIAEILVKQCRSVKVINVDGMPDKWDVADAVGEGWDWQKFKEWATPRAVLIAMPELPAPSTNGKHPVEDDDSGEKGQNQIAADLGLASNGKGAAYSNIDNVMRVLRGVPQFKDFVSFDEFYQRFFRSQDGGAREWTDLDTVKLTQMIQNSFGLPNITERIVWAAVSMYAAEHTTNAPRDWMDSLKWDGTKRINTFFWDCFGVEESDYSYAVGGNFWIAVVARIYRPGCQVDNMVILEGLQGVGKTSALRIIGGEWYMNAQESIQAKDFYLGLQGKLIVEISELESFSKAEISRIKQVITATSDRYRAPYERASADHPRRSVFVGTTNEKTYLRDNTGARRFWPLACQRIDLERIRRDREQLFAEAVHRFKAGETWYEMPGVTTGAEQEKRRQRDAWEKEIGLWLANGLLTQETTIQQVATECLKIDLGKLEMHIQTRIGKALSANGWEQCFPEHVWRRKS